MTNLQKKIHALAWPEHTNTSNQKLIRYCQDKPALNTILYEGLYTAISLYSKDTSEKNVILMIEMLTEEYSSEPVEVFVNVINNIMNGSRKIYGMVTPFDLREMITEELEEIAIKREREHYNNKGHSEQEISDRTSGRLSDFFNK